MVSDALSYYLPTVERARERLLGLPSDEPAHVERLAMLIVHAIVVRRTSWSEDLESAPAHLQRGEPPVPNDFEVRHHVRIDEALGGGRCNACVVNPGKRSCRVCSGTGALFGGKFLCSCERGFIVCPTCNGSSRSDRVRLRYYTDAPAYLSEAYVPTHVTSVPALFELERRMEEDIMLNQLLMPEELRCHDLTGRVAGSAYRGGGRVVRPDFHGYDFGDTIDKALAGLMGIGAGATVVRYDIRAYAWPFLRMQWSSGEDIGVYVDRQGVMQMSGAVE